MALAIAISLTLAEARDTTFAFITAMFALQMMVKSPHPPSLKQGFGFAVILIIATHVALTLTGALLNRPVVYLITLGLVFFACFYLQARGKGGPLPQLLLICNAMLPVLAVQSPDLAIDFADIMIEAAIGAPLVVWLVHGLLPAKEVMGEAPAPTAAAAVSPETALGRALVAMLVVMLPFAHYLAQAAGASFVILITCIGIVSQAPELQGRLAGGLLLGNLIGGVAATLAYLAVSLMPNLGVLFLMTLLVGLILGSRFQAGTTLAPVFGIALTTFLILFGLGLAPVDAGSGIAFMARLLDVASASLYAIGAIIVFATIGGLFVKHRAAAVLPAS